MAQYVFGYRLGLYIIGWGIWTGIIFASSGIVGFIGAFKPSKCMWVKVETKTEFRKLFLLTLLF